MLKIAANKQGFDFASLRAAIVLIACFASHRLPEEVAQDVEVGQADGSVAVKITRGQIIALSDMAAKTAAERREIRDSYDAVIVKIGVAAIADPVSIRVALSGVGDTDTIVASIAQAVAVLVWPLIGPQRTAYARRAPISLRQRA